MNHTSSLPPSRPDQVRSHIVDAGIAVADAHGRDVAAEYLARAGISFAVTVRVLTEPDRRRQARPT
ncbi:hypothetical protein AAKU55_000946 [Oxalobacteraceae bacterium GrIS 1.11]